jgi:hypothetical protein
MLRWKNRRRRARFFSSRWKKMIKKMGRSLISWMKLPDPMVTTWILCVIPPFAFKIVSENLSPNYSALDDTHQAIGYWS